jgi:hypothetical protein
MAALLSLLLSARWCPDPASASDARTVDCLGCRCGAALAAELVGARQAVIVVHPAVREILDEAVAERRRARGDPIRIRVVTAADRFVPARPALSCTGSSAASPRPPRHHPGCRHAAWAEADPGAERRDAGPPGAHRPLRRVLVPLGRHRGRTWHHAGHRPRGRARAMCPRNSHRYPGPGTPQHGRRRGGAVSGVADRRLLRTLGRRGGLRPGGAPALCRGALSSV